MNLFRRYIAAGFLCTGLAILAASPASAQAYNAADVGPPVIAAQGGALAAQGGVLGASGARAIVPAAAPSSQVLGLQVSQPAPLATGGQASTSGLAFTGADVITLSVIAISLMVLGLTLTRQARPRQASQG